MLSLSHRGVVSHFENWCIALVSVGPLRRVIVKDWSVLWSWSHHTESRVSAYPVSWGILRAHVAKRLCFAWWPRKAFFNQGNCVWWSWSFLFPSPFLSPWPPFLLTFCCLLGRDWDYFDVTLIISYPVFHLEKRSISVSGSPSPTWCSANCLVRHRRFFAAVGR